ncbi:MAG: hypothetical protein IJF67_04220 [Clostridia bacterium]|nr:hypothetical protein [Clostridia bacterium]
MKKITLRTLLTLALCAVILLLPLTAAAPRGKVLIVHGGADGLGAGDKAVADRLTSLGFTVDAIYAKNSTADSDNGYDLLYVLESVTSADVSTKFTDTKAAVIIGEPGLMDEFLVGQYDSTYDSNAYKGTYKVVNDVFGSGIKDAFKGFTTDDVIPGFLKERCKGSIVIAENEKGAPAVTLVKPGAELTDGSKANGYRVQWFFRRQDSANASAETWKLFDAAINYMFPKPAAASPTTVDPTLGLLLAAALGAGTFLASKKRR